MATTNPNRDYIRSERFIHDQLLERCVSLVETSKKMWRERKEPSIVVLWPGEPVRTLDGHEIEDEVIAVFPQENKQARLRGYVETTKAYGLLVIELQPHALSAVFESAHGTRAWTTPLETHGDVAVLAKTKVQDNVEHLGLLWSPLQGTA